MADPKVQILITAKDKTQKAFGSLDNSFKGTAKAVGLATAALAAFAIGIGVTAVKEAAEFEKQMNNVQTLLGKDAKPAVDQMAQSIKDMVEELPVTREDVGASLYPIISNGFTEAAEASEILRKSVELGIAGLGTTEESANLLTTALNAFSLGADEADHVADVLFKTVQAGNTDISRLGQAFGKMAGNAGAAGIKFEDVQAATAALTVVTGKTSESQNALAQVFLELTQKGGKLDKALQDQGSSLEKLNKQIGAHGLMEGLESVMLQTGQTATEFKNMFSSAEGGTAIFQLLTTANEAVYASLEDMWLGTNKMTEAVEIQKAGMEAQWQIMKNKLGVMFLELGEMILPHATKAIQNFSTWLTDNKDTIGEWVEKGFTGLENSFNWIANEGVPSVDSAIDEMSTYVYENQETFKEWEKNVNDAWTNIKDNVNNEVMPKIQEGFASLNGELVLSENNWETWGGAVGAILEGVVIFLGMMVKGAAIWASAIGKAIGYVIENWDKLTAGVKVAFDMHNKIFGKVWKLTLDLPVQALKNATLWAGKLYSKLSSAVGMGGKVGGMAEGGIVPKYFAGGGFTPKGSDTVPAMLTPGELILNAAQQKNLAGQMGGININLSGANFFGDDETFAEKIGDLIVDKIKYNIKFIKT